MTNIDRSWISYRMQRDKITLNVAYREGVEEFLKFASLKMEGCMIKRPCKLCKNLNWLGVDDVRFHLISEGMMESYTVWTSHGEVLHKKKAKIM